MNTVKITLTVGTETFEALFNDSPTSQSLLDQMPFSVQVEDYANKEKIFQPQTPLDLSKAPEGYTPKKGDLTCYGPWGNIAIFYKEHPYAAGLIHLGEVREIEQFISAIESTTQTITLTLKK